MPEVADGDLRRASSSADCLAGGGEMGALARSIDWSRTPIGPDESWSPALRMIVQVVLANRLQMLIWWGPQFCQLYNDAFGRGRGTEVTVTLKVATSAAMFRCGPEFGAQDLERGSRAAGQNSSRG